MRAQTVINAMRYYRESLCVDAIDALRFVESDFLTQKHKKIETKTHYVLRLKNKEALDALIRHCARKNKFYHKQQALPSGSSFNAFEFYYAKLLVTAPGRPNEEKKQFAPFYVGLKQPAGLDMAQGKRQFTHALTPALNLRRRLAVEVDHEADIFGHSEILINMALWEKPFELLDEDFPALLKEERIKRFGADLRIETYKHYSSTLHLIFKLMGYDSPNPDQKIEEFRQKLEQRRKANNQKNFAQEIEVEPDDFLIVVDSVELERQDKYNGGLIGLYNQILGGETGDENLFFRYLQGSPVAKSAVALSQLDMQEEQRLVRRYARLDLNDRIALAGRQMGAFDAAYALTPSQRYCLQMSKTGLDVLPVSGPPGTGKTSLLRAFVADYTIESALNLIAQRSGNLKNYNFAFRPPLAAFSTNNQALRNITGGITDGYLSIQTALGDYYTRWLDLPVNYGKKGHINAAELYAPMVKAGFKNEGGELVLPVSYLLDMLSGVEAELESYIRVFVAKANAHFQLFTTPVEKITDLAYALEKIFDRLREAIETGVDELKAINVSGLEESYARFGKNRELLLTFARLRKDDAAVDRVDRLVKSRKDMDEAIGKMAEHILQVQSRLDEHRRLSDEIHLRTQNEIVSQKDLGAQRMAAINQEMRGAGRAIEKEFADEITTRQALLDELVRLARNIQGEQERLRRKQESFFGRIEALFTKKNERLYEQTVQERKRYDEKVLEQKSILAQTAQTKKEKIAAVNAQFEAALAQVKRGIDEATDALLEAEASQTRTGLEKTLNDLRALSVFSLEDAERMIALKEQAAPDCVGPLDVIEEIDRVNQPLDGRRTRLFFDAIHLGEAALLLKLHGGAKKRPGLLCPHCKEGEVERTSGGLLLHKKCGFGFKPILKSREGKESRDLTQSEIAKAITQGKFMYDGRVYVLEKNENGGNEQKGPFKVWYNLWERNFASVDSTMLERLKMLSPVFPLLTTTAHAFAKAFSYYDRSEMKTVLPMGYFECVLVDEAGMILPSLMVNLHGAKRTLLFGDTKQIEPVYPFNGNDLVEKVMIDRVVDGDASEREAVIDGYSLLKQNAMTLANGAIFVDDPHAIRADERAPFWLLQHFRCAHPIIDYCNRLLYSGKIDPQKRLDQALLNRLGKLKDPLLSLGETALRQGDHLYFFDHRHPNGGRNASLPEAQIVLEIIKRCLAAGFGESEIGVISPFRNQVATTAQTLRAAGINTEALYVGTVHKFQGSERSVIVFTSAVGDATQSDKLFMNKDGGNMLNVAVSRAKDLFILVGNSTVLAATPSPSAKLVEHIRQYGCEVRL